MLDLPWLVFPFTCLTYSSFVIADSCSASFSFEVRFLELTFVTLSPFCYNHRAGKEPKRHERTKYYPAGQMSSAVQSAWPEPSSAVQSTWPEPSRRARPGRPGRAGPIVRLSSDRALLESLLTVTLGPREVSEFTTDS